MFVDVRRQRSLFADLEIHVDDFMRKCWKFIAKAYCVHTSNLWTGKINSIDVLQMVQRLVMQYTYLCCKLMWIKLWTCLLIQDFLIWSFQHYIDIILATSDNLKHAKMSIRTIENCTNRPLFTWYSKMTVVFLGTSSWKQSRALSGRSNVNSTPKTLCDMSTNAEK